MTTKVRLPDGTHIMASPLSSRRAQHPDRDAGLYMDPSWEPTWDATMINWPDFGVPVDSHVAAQQIVDAFSRAKRGERMEIGCIGGKGRTGTVLACMAVLAGVSAHEAVAWVRDHYHPKAVETDEQAAWVQWFADHIDSTNRPTSR